MEPEVGYINFPIAWEFEWDGHVHWVLDAIWHDLQLFAAARNVVILPGCLQRIEGKNNVVYRVAVAKPGP